MSRHIDADLLKQSIPNTKMDEFENCRYCRLLDEEQVKDLIDQQPTADVRENVHGKWEIYCDENGKVTDCYCNQCGCNSFIGGNFCPNCGADMRGEA